MVTHEALSSNKTFKEVQDTEGSRGAGSGSGWWRCGQTELCGSTLRLPRPPQASLHPSAPQKADPKGYLTVTELSDLQGPCHF